MSKHIVPLKLYFLIFGVLAALTALTVLVAYFDLGFLNIFVAMTIAIVKATLVILFFMHVRYSSHVTQLFVAAGVAWFIVLVAFTMSDFLTRDWQVLPQGWQS